MVPRGANQLGPFQVDNGRINHIRQVASTVLWPASRAAPLVPSGGFPNSIALDCQHRLTFSSDIQHTEIQSLAGVDETLERYRAGLASVVSGLRVV